MSSRALEIAAFLDLHGWGEAAPQAFTADFSPRRYARLVKESGKTAILMDADEEQKTPAFVALARTLRQTGLQAPEIYAAEANRGLVLMEDFGTRNVGSLLDAGEEALPFFLRAAEVLAALHNSFSGKGLPVFDTALLTSQVGLFLTGYLPVALEREASPEEQAEFTAAWHVVLRPLENLPQSLLLRDFMPDNLMELPTGALGLLDFQDAGIGPVAYDLASLCEEVRRDGGFAFLKPVIAHYRKAAQNPPSEGDLVRACTVLSAQRHMRILGILAQLAVQKGRREKLTLMPRVKTHLIALLREPCLMPVRIWVETFGESLL